MSFRFVLLLLPAVLVLVGTAGAQTPKKPGLALPPPSTGNEIAPPFSLVWHEPSERLEGKISAAKLAIAERREIGNRLAVMVTGFKKPDPKDPSAPKPPELKRVVFYFLGGSINKTKGRDGKAIEKISGGQLVEVELQYSQDGWDEDRYSACLGEKRGMLERLYGPGQQLVRNITPTPDGNAQQTLVGYKWNKNNTAVELIYFNVSQNSGGQQFHTLSLHYKRS